MNRKLLYISCHSRLEGYNYRIFDSLGFDVVSVGWYTVPSKPTDAFLRALPYKYNKELVDEFYTLNPNYRYNVKTMPIFSDGFLNKFDVIVIAWRYDILVHYWNILKDKLVLFETGGQSASCRERNLASYRGMGVKLIRVADSERNFPYFAGVDCTVGAYVDTDVYSGWTGEDSRILTINSSLKRRASACNANLYLQVTHGLNKVLYGSDNKDLICKFYGGTVSDEEMLLEYKKSRLYFSLGSKPAPITYTPMEALSVGCPVITWGAKLGGLRGSETYEMYKYIENGISGFCSDDLNELREVCCSLLHDHSLAKNMSKGARDVALKNFSFEVVKNRWKSYLESLGVL